MKRVQDREGAAPGGTADPATRATVRPEAPFETGPIVMHRGFREARDQVLSELAGDSKLILVAGPAGIGKSLLLQEITRSLRIQGTVDVIVEAHDTLPSASLARDSERGGQRRTEPRRRVVLVDEAFQVDPAAIDRLWRHTRCAFVLADLDRGRLCSATPRFPPGMTVVRLQPLTLDEAEAFVVARTIQLGMAADAISREAAARIAERSGGLPAALNALSSVALRLARSEGAYRIEVRHVERAAMGLSYLGPVASTLPRARQRRHGVVRTLAQVGAVALAGSALLLWRTERIWHVQDDADETIVASGTAVQAALKPTLLSAFSANASAKPTDPGEVACKVGGTMTACGGVVHLQGAPVEMPAMGTVPVPLPPPEPLTAVERSLPPIPVLPALPPAMAAASDTGTPQVASSVPNKPTIEPRVAEALPMRAPVRVMLRYAPGTLDAGTRAERLARSLRAAGFMVDAATVNRAVPAGAPGGAQYFYAEDQASADAVLKAAGMSGQATMTPAATPRPPGLIELILPAEPVETAGRS